MLDYCDSTKSLERVRRILARPVPSLGLSQRDDGRVYFVQAGENGPIKIGTALDVGRRIKKLQQASAVKLAVLCSRRGGRVTERAYHDRFREHHLRGEWFSPHPDILAEIARLTNGA